MNSRALILSLRNRIKLMLMILFVTILSPAPMAGASLPIDIVNEINEKIALWKKYTVTCQSKSEWSPDPSMLEPDLRDDNCSSSDMNLFNGLLCAAGNEEGCLAVQRAQDSEGRWWRSPFRALHRNCTLEDVSNNIDSTNCSDTTFSADMDLGTQIYVYITQDRSRLKSWLDWIEDNRPCTINNPFNDGCILKGTPRYCIDRNCTMKWDGALMLTETTHALGMNVGEGIDGMRHSNIMPLSDWILSSSSVSNEGFSLHLVGVEIFLLRNILHRGDLETLNKAAARLSSRQPLNPFFSYLNEGPTVNVWNKIVNTCPASDAELQKLINDNSDPKNPPRSDWQWQRADGANAWRASSLWDCIFMAQIVLNQDNFVNPLR